MKKRFLAIAIAAGLASPFAAQAEANVYGQLNLSYGMIDYGASDNWEVESHASRLGVKGSEDLGNGLSANYQLEYGVVNDIGSPGLSARNQWVGLKGGFGEVRVGRHDTPLKISQGKFDQFGDMYGDIAAPDTGLDLSKGDLRVANAVAYLNKVGDIKFAIALVPGEGDGTTTGGDGPADTISAAVIYESGPLYVALAMDSYDDANTNGGLNLFSTAAPIYYEDQTRLTVTYAMGTMDFGFMYETATSVSGNDDLDGMGFSFGMGMGKNTAKFQYLMGEMDNNGPEVTSMSLGYDWGLSKGTTLGVSYTDIEEETGAATTGEFTWMGVNLLHKF